MFDTYNRPINYLRVSVTDKCDLRCHYCMPPEGVSLLDHRDILSYEEFVEVIKVAVELGIEKVRITGGEPLVKRNIVGLVSMISKIDGIRDFGMTTNGTRLREYASQLARAGLHRVNVSLDAVDPGRYREITRCGDVNKVLDGIDAAIDAGLTPVKLNCVIMQSVDEPDAQDVAEYADKKGLEVRYIRRMTTTKGEFWPVIGGDGGHCETCNRLRLTCSGNVKPCLFSDIKFNVRELGIRQALEMAIKYKPEAGCTSNNEFYRVGG